MKSSQQFFYFLTCLLEYLVLFALESALLEIFAPLLTGQRVSLILYLFLLWLINPVLIWLTAEKLLHYFGKDIQKK